MATSIALGRVTSYADFCAANVEYIRVPGNILQSDIGRRGCQAVTQARSVQKQRDLEAAAKAPPMMMTMMVVVVVVAAEPVAAAAEVEAAAAAAAGAM